MNFKRADDFMFFSDRTSPLVSAAAIAAIGLMLWQTPLHAAGNPGEAKFKEHCSACHPNGGNIVKKDRTLLRKDREKHGVKTSQDIIKTMRNPGEGMTPFDKKTVSDKDAKAIADYIIKTFK